MLEMTTSLPLSVVVEGTFRRPRNQDKKAHHRENRLRSSDNIHEPQGRDNNNYDLE